MGFQKGDIDRINILQKETKELQKEIKQFNANIDKHIIRHIVEDLRKRKFEGSQKPLYTYQEIANKYNTSKSSIQRIASKFMLSRRQKQII